MWHAHFAGMYQAPPLRSVHFSVHMLYFNKKWLWSSLSRGHMTFPLRGGSEAAEACGVTRPRAGSQSIAPVTSPPQEEISRGFRSEPQVQTDTPLPLRVATRATAGLDVAGNAPEWCWGGPSCGHRSEMAVLGALLRSLGWLWDSAFPRLSHPAWDWLPTHQPSVEACLWLVTQDVRAARPSSHRSPHQTHTVPKNTATTLFHNMRADQTPWETSRPQGSQAHRRQGFLQMDALCGSWLVLSPAKGWMDGGSQQHG